MRIRINNRFRNIILEKLNHIGEINCQRKTRQISRLLTKAKECF